MRKQAIFLRIVFLFVAIAVSYSPAAPPVAVAPSSISEKPLPPEVLSDERLLKAIQTGPATDETVLKSIRAGVEFLLSVRDVENHPGWGNLKTDNDFTDYSVAATSLALSALLHAGESIDDKRLTPHSKELAPAIAWLAKQKIEDTYSAGLAASALACIKNRTPEVSAQMERLRMFFVGTLNAKGGYGYGVDNMNRGRLEAGIAWAEAVAAYKQAKAARAADPNASDYTEDPTPRLEAAVKVAEARYLRADTDTRRNPGTMLSDLSNSQFGAMGAWALADAGLEFPIQYWTEVDRFWRRMQLPSGGWPYNETVAREVLTMNIAGMASLYVTQEYLDDGVRLEPRRDAGMANGLAEAQGTFDPNGDLYYQYGVERFALASGLKFLKQTNWYTTVARKLMARQAAEGSWLYAVAAPNLRVNSRVIGTSWALLFLVRGRNAVLFNKLEYDGPWNARPRDDAHITDWLSKKFEKPLNWQIVDFKHPVEDWLDAPVLLITGSKALKFSAADIEKLRGYINAGGTIFSTADGGKEEFTESIKKIASEVVAEKGKPKYEFRELPPEHVLFSLKNELWTPIKNPPRILGMSNGIREIWVHSTVDMGATWQGRNVATQAHYDFAGNLWRYVSGKLPLRTKLQLLTVPAVNAGTVRAITVARLDHAGNWDPEPGAWPRFANIMTIAAKTRVAIKNVPIAKLDFKATPVAHMTGTTRFPARDEDVAALRKFIAEGGTLLIDAAANNADFRASVNVLLGKVLAEDSAVEPIPLTSKIYNGTVPDSYRITKVDYRLSYRQNVANRDTPQLRGAQVNGRYAVIVSDEDMTSGLLGTNTWGVLGYTPDSAQVLLLNMLLYSSDPKAGKDGATAAP